MIGLYDLPRTKLKSNMSDIYKCCVPQIHLQYVIASDPCSGTIAYICLFYRHLSWLRNTNARHHKKTVSEKLQVELPQHHCNNPSKIWGPAPLAMSFAYLRRRVIVGVPGMREAWATSGLHFQNL